MSRASHYGIDSASYSHVPWCKCGWRDLSLRLGKAREQLCLHMESNHGISRSTVMRIRSEAQARMWGIKR